MITADQLLCHAIGDYILQSDWMAQNKRREFYVASAHAFVYACCFLPLSPSIMAFFIICGTHAFIDRYGLARYVVYAKNYLAPPKHWEYWEDCTGTGYPRSRPDFLSVWLLIIADNTLHVLINGAALKWL